MTTGDAQLDAIMQAALEDVMPFLEDIQREYLEAAAVLEEMLQAEHERTRPFLEDMQRQAAESLALLDDLRRAEDAAAGRGDNRHT